MKKWSVSDIENAKYLGTVEIEISKENSLKPELSDFEVLRANNRLVFGGACNVGFIESGYMEIEYGESTDCALQELIEDLEVYYRDGKNFVSRIICNERM